MDFLSVIIVKNNNKEVDYFIETLSEIIKIGRSD